MKRLLFLLMFTAATGPLCAQYVYTINADSVKITNHCDTAELIIENHTQNVPGFLFNKGRGRTEFRRGLFTIDDTLYLVGGDTLNLGKGLNSLTANNGVLKTGNTLQFGNFEADPYTGPATQTRNTYYNQNTNIFNWLTGEAGILTVSKDTVFSRTENDVLREYHTARFFSPQGGIILEGNTPAGNGPLQWISFKNDYPGQAKYSFFGDSVAAIMLAGQVVGTDGMYHTTIDFLAGNDSSALPAASSILKLSPTLTSVWGNIKVPTAIAQRIEIEDPTPGCSPCTGALNNANPYSRLVVNAKNYPLVVGNLPSNTGGHSLIIDDDGKVWKGDSAVSQPTAWSLTGNSGTIPGANFIGTTDYQPLSISTNSTEAINIQPTGYVGIGTGNPLTKVQIYKAGEDGQFAVTGDAPSMRLWGPTADYTSGVTYSAVMGLGTTIADYSADAVAGDLVISDFSHNAIIFSTNYLSTYLAHQDEKMRIDGDGHVGINTHNPTAKLHVVDSVRFESLPAGTGNYLLIDGDGYLHVSGQAAAAVTLPDSINSSLAVNGDISAHRVRLQQTAWPDYVFDSAYRRPSLPELEQYIKHNNHLPEIPAAAEIAQKGIDVGDNQAVLLKKIEELTLYLIEQEKKWQAQEEIVKKQNKELEALRQEMDEIKKTITKKP